MCFNTPEVLITELNESSMTTEIISRAEATAKGLKSYFTGKPCKKDHLSERLVSTRQCRECNREWRSLNAEALSEGKRKWFLDHREEYLERFRKYGRENREQARKHLRKWRLAHPEKKRAEGREYYRKNSEKMLEYGRKWARENPDKAYARCHRHRARKLAAPGSYTSQDIAEILELQHGKCAYCFIKLNGKYQVDHHVSLKRGGTNSPDNLRLTCTFKYGNGCNQRKSAKDPLDFARELGRLL